MRDILDNEPKNQRAYFAFVRRAALQYPGNEHWPASKRALFKAVLMVAREPGKNGAFQESINRLLSLSGNDKNPSGTARTRALAHLKELRAETNTGAGKKPVLPPLIVAMKHKRGIVSGTVHQWWLARGKMDRIPLVTPRGRIAANLQMICGWMASNAESKPETASSSKRRLLKRVAAHDWHGVGRGLRSLNTLHQSWGLPTYEIVTRDDGRVSIVHGKEKPLKKAKRKAASKPQVETEKQMLARLMHDIRHGDPFISHQAKLAYQAVLDARHEVFVERM